MGFKLRSQEDPVVTKNILSAKPESTMQSRANLMTASNNTPAVTPKKNFTPNLRQSQPSVNVESHGGGDIGISKGGKFNFGGGVNINPRVEGLRANVGYKDKLGVGVEKTKFGTTVNADASFGNFNINASQESGELGYQSIGGSFNKGSFSGGADFTQDNQGDRNISANASFSKNGARVGASGNLYNDTFKGSLGGSLRMGRTTLNASTNVSPNRRTSFGLGATYRF